MYSEIAGREWQQAALDKFSEDNPLNFFVEACPGGGKTRFAIAAAAYLMSSDKIDNVIVVAPQVTVASQWCEESVEHLRSVGVDARAKLFASAFGGTSAQHFAREFKQLNPNIMVFTYAGVACQGIATILEAHCAAKRTLVIFDEIHHAADDSSWGIASLRAFGGAKHRLLLSGTPFRGKPIRDGEGNILRFSEGGKIPYANYIPVDGAIDGEVSIKTDFSFSYAEAVERKDCRPIVFQRLDGLIEWNDTKGGATFAMGCKMSDAVDESTRTARMSAALSDESTMTVDNIRASLDKLYDVRHDHPDAAMLVVADSISHAYTIRDHISETYGVDAPVVSNDDKGSVDIINAFKESSDPIIISVQMFSEGVDAPRIRVISYLSRRTAPLFFRQVIGRAVRMQYGDDIPKADDQWAYMYMAADQDLDAMASEIEDSLSHIVGVSKPPPPKDKYCPECGGKVEAYPRLGSPCPHCGYEPHGDKGLMEVISGEGVANGFISMGVLVGQKDVEDMTSLRKTDRLLQRFPVEVLALVREIAERNSDKINRFNEEITI